MDDLMNLEVERAQRLISDSLKKLVDLMTADQFLKHFNSLKTIAHIIFFQRG